MDFHAYPFSKAKNNICAYKDVCIGEKNNFT